MSVAQHELESKLQSVSELLESVTTQLSIPVEVQATEDEVTARVAEASLVSEDITEEATDDGDDMFWFTMQTKVRVKNSGNSSLFYL